MEENHTTFFKKHAESVRGVAFSPRDRYLFCSGGSDGKVNVYSAFRKELLHTYHINTTNGIRHVTAVRFTAEGGRILATTSSRRLAVLDVERGDAIIAYDNCCHAGRERTGLGVNPNCAHTVVSPSVSGRGLTVYDLRMPQPLEFLYNIHESAIRDITFLDQSWPWFGGTRTLLTAGTDGVVKISSLDGITLHQFHTNHTTNTVCPTPELYNAAPSKSFYSIILTGGDIVSSYIPDVGVQEVLTEHKKRPVWKIRYTSSGSTLFTASEDGCLRRYRRYPDYHQYLNKILSHQGAIYDFDISPYDEYLVTASKDKTVGLLKLGNPNHGPTQTFEFT